MAGPRSWAGPRELLLFLLVVILCLSDCEAGKKKKPCRYNGKKYKPGEVIVALGDNCVELKCSENGKMAEIELTTNCVCGKDGEQEYVTKIVKDIMDNANINLNEKAAKKKKRPCKYNKKKYKAGEVIELLEENCVEIKCSIKGKKTMLEPMKNCVCDKYAPTTPIDTTTAAPTIQEVNNTQEPTTTVDPDIDFPSIISFEEFLSRFTKEYENEFEKLKRLAIFSLNILRIEAHNKLYEAGLFNYKKGVNKFSDINYEEFVRDYTGLNETDIFTRLTNYDAYDPINLGQEPESLDYRDIGAVNPVRDQGQCGSCWTFAAASSIESQIFLKGGILPQLSEQYIGDCSSDNMCDGGSLIKAIDYVRANGLVYRNYYPYTARDQTCKSGVHKTSFKVKGQKYVRGDENLLNALVHLGPLAVSIYTAPSIKDYKGGINDDRDCEGNHDTTHAVTLVGYGEENGKKYWLLRNSWGYDYGENGYFRISRDKVNYCSISKHAGAVPVIEASFVGPYENHWSDADCWFIIWLKKQSLSDCKLKCKDTQGCTAINYWAEEGCELRACTLPVPEPQSHNSLYQGYKIGEAFFVGPYKNIWSGSECRSIKYYQDMSLSDCKLECKDTPYCTSINYSEHYCYLRACTLPVPEPQTYDSPYQGYTIGEGGPEGSFGLLKPKDRCPSSPGTWEEGGRKQDTEDSSNTNDKSNPYDLHGGFSDSGIWQDFCIKTNKEGSPWPAGNYCIHREGGSCPPGFGHGNIFFDDQDDPDVGENNDNHRWGNIPDGDYDHNTRYEYCCRKDGRTDNYIDLPFDTSFVLYPHTEGCQKVAGMTPSMQWVFYDNEDSSPTSSAWGEHPKVDGKDGNWKLFFCYYH